MARTRPGQDEKKQKKDVIEAEGVITEALPNAMFRVQLESGHNVSRTSPAKCECITFASYSVIA